MSEPAINSSAILSAVMRELGMLPKMTRFSNRTKSRYRHCCFIVVMVNRNGH